MWCTVPPTLLVASTFLALVQGERILAVFSMASYSHFKLGFRLAKELADKGHKVTLISAFPQKEPIKNLNEISVAEIRKGVNQNIETFYEIGKKSYIEQLSWIANLGLTYTQNVLKVKAVQELLHSNEQFDLVLIEHFMNEAMAIFQHKFKCPSVVMAPGPTTIFVNHLFANPTQSAYVPNILTSFGSHMTFWERALNTYYDIVAALHVYFVHIPNQNAILQKYVPGAPHLTSILYNASFLLLTSHISITDPSPLQPNIKEIGGFHLLPPKPLPEDIKEFLDNAKEGVIIFTMGSILNSAHFPREKRDAILKVFSRLKQKVLWKFETDMPNKSENVKIVNWMPQQDVLGHQNVVAFITHVGLLGKIEAIYHGVPILGLPVFWDQKKNSYDAVRHGFGIAIPLYQLTEENFGWALNELINNPRYRENAKMRSKLMRDQPVKQIDEAMFWIEYIIRHKGAPLYRSAALNLRWYQTSLLDVILVISVTAATVLAVTVYLLKRILYYTTRKFMTKEKNLKKLK